MPEQILDGTGSSFLARVDDDNRLLVNSVSEQTIPTDDSKNNPAYEFKYITSGASTGVTGSSVGSIIQHIGTGSYVQVLTWNNDLITNVGSYS